MQKSEQKSNKREAVRTEMQKMRRKSFYFFLPVILVIFTGCSTSASKKTIPEKNTEEIAALQKTVAEQQELLQNLWALTVDQMRRSSELEQEIPPRDLLESLQNGFVELREKTSKLEKQVSALQKSVTNLTRKEKETKAPEPDLPKDQKQLLRGLISLQAGNPDQAVEQLKKILNQKKPTLLKGEILLAIAHSFLAQGHSKQAASHYGIFLSEYPKSRHVPQALFYLGEAMQELGERKKQKVIWKELIKKYPKSPFAKRAK